MASIPVPFVNRSVSTDTDGLMTVVMVSLGFGLLYIAANVGQRLAGGTMNFLGISGSDRSVDVI